MFFCILVLFDNLHNLTLHFSLFFCFIQVFCRPVFSAFLTVLCCLQGFICHIVLLRHLSCAPHTSLNASRENLNNQNKEKLNRSSNKKKHDRGKEKKSKASWGEKTENTTERRRAADRWGLILPLTTILTERQDIQSHTHQCRPLLLIYQYINYEVECHSMRLMRLKATLTAVNVLFLTDQSLFKDKETDQSTKVRIFLPHFLISFFIFGITEIIIMLITVTPIIKTQTHQSCLACSRTRWMPVLEHAFSIQSMFTLDCR